MDRWTSKTVSCEGGLIQNLDALRQGTEFPGSAVILQNYEPSTAGGYRRMLGTAKWDSTVVPGEGAVLGVGVGIGGVFAVRKVAASADYALYFSAATGWTKVSTPARANAVTKARILPYTLTQRRVMLTDGANYAAKYDGSTYTLINGASAPTNPKYAELFRNRIVFAGYSASTSAIILTAPNTDDDCTAASGAAEINVGDTVVGIKVFRDTLYIFCENSLKQLTGSSSADFAVKDVTNSYGCLSGDTIQELGGDLIYLSPDGLRSVASTDRVNDIEMSLVSDQIRPAVSDITGLNLPEQSYSSCLVRAKSQYRLFMLSNDIPEADTPGILGKMLTGRTSSGGLMYNWATMRGLKPYCAASAYVSNQEVAVIGHPTNGYVYRLEQGNTFDGTNFTSIFRTPDMTFDDASIRKVFQKVDIYTQIAGSCRFNVNLILDRSGANIPQPNAIPIEDTASVSLYGTGVYGTATYSSTLYPVYKTNLVGSGFTGAFEFTSSSSDAPHRIDSFQIQLAVKGRR